MRHKLRKIEICVRWEICVSEKDFEIDSNSQTEGKICRTRNFFGPDRLRLRQSLLLFKIVNSINWSFHLLPVRAFICNNIH